MAEFIVNPRRAPRAPVRCHAAVVGPSCAFDAETEDVGARGCQVVSPSLVKKGDRLELVLTSEDIPGSLKTVGQVAWVSDQAPWRVGIAFEDAFVPSAERWFEKLVAATPSAGSFRRVPEKISVEAMVYLAPPPRFLLDFSAEEASLLRAIGSGVRVDELEARQRDRWPAAQRALFSLLARQAVTLSRGQSAHPNAWKQILADLEASLAVESLAPLQASPGERPLPTPLPMRPLAAPLPPPPPPPFTLNPAASPWGAAQAEPPPPPDARNHAPRAGAPAPAPAQPRGAARAQPGEGWAEPAASGGAGGPPGRRPAEERSPEAQALYEGALAELDAGNVDGAVTFLRHALNRAPGDPEIAAVLAKLASRDSFPGKG